MKNTVVKNIVHVENFTTKSGEEKKNYTVIGTCFETEMTNTQTGEIFTSQSLKFDFLPTDLNKGFIQIMERKEKK